MRQTITAIGLFLMALFAGSPAAAAQAEVQTSWRLLDYIAVDYREAVRDGRIINQAEYDEMVEFSRSARERIAALPDNGSRQALEQQATRLEELISQRAQVDRVAEQARQLAEALLQAHPVPLAPAGIPDLQRGAQIYAAQCASCHGASGDGNGPLAEGMDPPPIAFTDRERAAERSIFALYQVVTQGLEETAMQSFAHLPTQDRWAVSFHAGQLAFSPEEVERGRQLWQSSAELRARIDLQKLVSATPADFREEFGEADGTALMAFLRSHPEALSAGGGGEQLSGVRERVAEAVEAYAAGDQARARTLAVAAYLEGFEPIEPALAARDEALVRRVEGAMTAFRAAIADGEPLETVQARAAAINELIVEAEAALQGGETGWWVTFLGAFLVLLREGLEAILLVAAAVALLKKAGRADLMPYVHGGWVSAIVAGVLTWIAAATLISISGAARELVEGFGAIIAAFILLWVGIWMHGKSRAGAWQQHMQERLSKALSGKSVWYLFGLIFLIVYREAFETILFYIALLQQGSGAAVLAGGGTAACLLLVIGWALLRISARLPISTFFAWTSVLMAVLAVVLIGKGTAALQEAGWLPATMVEIPIRSELLGVYPTLETLTPQIGFALILVLLFWSQRRSGSRRST